MKNIIYFLISMIFPRTCACCGKTLHFNKKNNICAYCFDSFLKIEGLVCKKCSMPLQDGGAHCYDCKDNKNIYFEVLKAPYVYKDNIKKIIKKFKYSNRYFLADELSQPMIDLIHKEDWCDSIDIILPVPLHFVKKFKRGYNQSYLLAKHIATSLHKPVYKDILLRKKNTKAQFGLGREEREKNLEDTFVVDKKYKDIIKGKKILLIDDIATTCTTVNQCAKVLKQSKVKKVFVVTIARAK
ncbi:MAG: ComF family protein [Endomicrobiia bacterium]|nr:ComF family protein [Endomicrobiaceae bacterium]MDD3052859.1 ComF family protein [Endomicrobiaceae bacterium]MDD3922777.1 ComF family protein [Endomicrobiaceae bacterium]MDD5101762.1 ComF family protein [Endomicrobiaceae bacterium]